MRNFKIIVVSTILILLASLGLYGIKGLISTNEPGPDDTYHEDSHDEEGDIYSKQLKQYEGTVKLLGISIYQEGTHRLEKDDTLLLILESSKVKLEEFEGKEVKVRGFVRDTVEGGQKIMDVASIELVTDAGVKLFNEVGYEFSFSYPSDWQVKKEADKVTFSRKNGEKDEILLVVYQYEDIKDSVEKWLKDRDQNLFYEEAQIKVGDTTGVRRTVKNGDEQIIKTYVKEGDNAYEIRLVSQDEVIKNQYFSIVDFFKTNFTADESIVETEAEEGLSDTETTEEDMNIEEEKTDDEEKNEEASEKPLDTETPESTEESSESFSDLEPLTADQVEKVIAKGFTPFKGRTLSFEFPTLWYFSYLGDGKYGMTDDVTYKSNNEEITEALSRITFGTGSYTSCSQKLERKIEDTTYTVCAREPGLGKIIERIAQSIALPIVD